MTTSSPRPAFPFPLRGWRLAVATGRFFLATLIATSFLIALCNPDWAGGEEPFAAPTPPNAAGSPGEAASPAADVEFFEGKIRPLFAAHCLECHGPEKQKASLRLDSRASIVTGGDSGSEVSPGKPSDSRLLAAVGYENPDLQMPPKGKLSEGEINDLQRWVEIGAPWGPDSGAHGGPSVEGAAKKAPFDLAARKARHWAWQPVRAQEIPKVKNEAWLKQPLDAFVLARLEAAGLAPVDGADRRVLARRAWFDLLGLPPTPREVETFVADAAPDAWPRLIDRLLAGPQFGERWARHWLDLARFAESRGHEYDYEIPNAFQYRDYVIRAFNADLPYDQFVVEHVAGDLLDPPRRDAAAERNESVLATGFWLLGEWLHSPVDIRQDELDRVDNQIDVFGKTFLGMTVACARCHDHKFDAISTADYYSLMGFLHSSSFRDVAFEHQTHNRDVARRLRELEDATTAATARRIAERAEPSIARAADYLLAAREVPRGAAAGDRAAGAAEIAAERGLDAGLMQRWIEELAGPARKNAAHPLHGWAVGIFDRGPAGDSPTGPAASARFEAVVRSWIQSASAARPVPESFESIVDYSHLRPGQWITDGDAFGDGPRPSGAWRHGKGDGEPLVGQLPRACADTAGLGAAVPGMLRTPPFVISRPGVWYLVRGSADVFLVIDSHRMIFGPLHAGTRQTIHAPDWSWRHYDVARYQGQRAHLEFRPARPTRDVAVMACVQSASEPPGPRRACASLLAALEAPGAITPSELANRYQRSLAAACRSLATDAASPVAAGASSPGGDDWTELAGWLVERRELFGFGPAEKEATRQAIAEDARTKAALVGEIKKSATAMALLDGAGFDERVLQRGNHATPGPPAPRRLLEALGGRDHPAVGPGSGRLELARQLVDPANPLVARVMVNRVWHHLLGRGIVTSVDNFGVMGAAPSHPELLDYLADRFVKDGWSLKRLIREVMLSATYQLASRADDSLLAADPQNRLFGRAGIRRLEGEAIRDAMLSLSGDLNPAIGGVSVEVYVPAGAEARGKPASGPLDGGNRRSIYTRVRRNFLPPMMTAFDMPGPFNTMGRRTVSNVPAQALILLNDPLVVEMAKRWATRALRDADRPAAERIREMYLAAFARPPLDGELAIALDFIERDAELRGVPIEQRRADALAWVNLAHVLLNTKEFIYLN